MSLTHCDSQVSGTLWETGKNTDSPFLLPVYTVTNCMELKFVSGLSTFCHVNVTVSATDHERFSLHITTEWKTYKTDNEEHNAYL